MASKLLRYPSTSPEMRAADAATQQGVRVRAKRQGHNLPDAWDDRFRHRERSWKRNRKTRWK